MVVLGGWGGEAGGRTAVLSVGVRGWELEDVVEPQRHTPSSDSTSTGLP